MNSNILDGFTQLVDDRVRDLIIHGFTDMTPEDKIILFEKYIRCYKEVINHRDMQVRNNPEAIKKAENVLKFVLNEEK